MAASWSDNVSKTCKASLSLTPTVGSATSVASGITLSEAGTLTLTVTDEAGNASSAEITLTRVDSGAPAITLEITEYNVIAGVKVSIQGSQFLFDDKTAASWKDDFTAECTVSLLFKNTAGTEAEVKDGDTLSEAGTLTLTVTDEAGNASSAEITLTRVDSGAPAITLEITEYNVIAGVKVSIQGSQFLFDDKTAASWKDDFTAECTVSLLFKNTAGTEAEVKDGATLSEAGILTLTVTDEAGNAASAEITLTAVAIYGLEALQQLSLQVDQETDLLAGLTVAEGLTLDKVEIEADGNRSPVADPVRYTPEYPGTVTILLTLSKSGGTLTLSCGPLAVKPLDYSPIALETADVINSQYDWYNKLLPEKKTFVYPHILTSYLT